MPPIQGVSQGHHDLSHHGKEPHKLEQLKIVEEETMKTVRDLLAKLKQSQEDGASLLDRFGIQEVFGMHNYPGMPIGEFAGARNWGYDGVLWYAPDHAYGAPDDLKTLIDLAAAGHGLTLLPETAVRDQGVTAVHVALPRLCHRLELIHAALPKRSPVAALAAILSQR